MNNKILSFISKLVKDENGKIVIIQAPNLPIIGWLIFSTIAYFIPAGLLKTGFADLGTVFLFVWAYLEITQGVNYFRKFLGVVVAIILIFAIFNL